MTDPLELLPDQRIAHIVAADSADLILVAPATARWLAAMAAGLADDVVTATCLASAAPVVIAPAMDGEMYGHPATRANVEKLLSYGYTIVEPEFGPLASGQVGRGRLAEPADILAAVDRALEGRADTTARSGGTATSRHSGGERGPGRAGTSSSPRAARRSRSTRCATSATARPARWASRSPRRRWHAARE